MSSEIKALICIGDLADGGGETYYICHDGQTTEATAERVVSDDAKLICHDYWMIAPALLRKVGSLPKYVVDVEELRISTSGRREDRENRESANIFSSLAPLVTPDEIARYRSVIQGREAPNPDTLVRVGSALISLFEEAATKAKLADEWDRYLTIERPAGDYLISCAARGITINTDALKRHKKEIDHAYYMALKNFSAHYSLPLHPPSDEEIVDYLLPRGFDFEGVGVDYVLNFIPMQDGFADRVLELRKLATSRWMLNSIPSSQKIIYPIVDVFGSITSRVYFRDPALQNIAKRHRDIISPDRGMQLSYVDYEQYEAGIMGALSNDERMISLFSSGDLYASAANQIFGDVSMRKQAKRLFLSYAYGMKRKSLVDAAVQLGAQRNAARQFYSQFEQFESWKLKIWESFRTQGRIGTALGNYLVRSSSDELTDKEKRSAVSQVVQGTASLIFKKALIELSQLTEIELKLPMHDAVLFQHRPTFDPMGVADLMSGVMTEHFHGQIKGKAALATFFEG